MGKVNEVAVAVKRLERAFGKVEWLSGKPKKPKVDAHQGRMF